MHAYITALEAVNLQTLQLLPLWSRILLILKLSSSSSLDKTGKFLRQNCSTDSKQKYMHDHLAIGLEFFQQHGHPVHLGRPMFPEGLLQGPPPRAGNSSSRFPHREARTILRDILSQPQP